MTVDPSIAARLEGVERYNPQNLPVLEEYLDRQCSQHGYDADANLTILKFYQFNPSEANPKVVVKVLLKALTALPDADFLLSLFLIGTKMLEDAEVKQVCQLQRHLEESNYVEFWTEAEDAKELTKSVVGFTDDIRNYIAKIISFTFQTVSLSNLEDYLNLKGDALKQYVAKLGWTEVDGIVSIPLNSENQAKPGQTQETIKFEHLTKVIAQSSA